MFCVPQRIAVGEETRVYFLTGSFARWNYYPAARGSMRSTSTAQSQKAVSVYLKSKQILPFGFANKFCTALPSQKVVSSSTLSGFPHDP